MNTTSIVATALTLSLGATPALAGYGGQWRHGNAFTDRARVIDVDPIHETVRVENPRRDCWKEQAVARDYEDGHDGDDVRAGEGMIAGSIIGGVIGSQIGKGDGRKAATVLGTIVGAAVGRDMASGGGHGRRAWPAAGTRCRVSYDTHEEERIVGYRVTYRYQGKTFTRRMDHDPGRWLRVRVRVLPDE